MVYLGTVPEYISQIKITFELRFFLRGQPFSGLYLKSFGGLNNVGTPSFNNKSK